MKRKLELCQPHDRCVGNNEVFFPKELQADTRTGTKQLAVCSQTVLVLSAFLMKASFSAYVGKSYRKEPHCSYRNSLACWTGKGLEQCCGLCDSCTFQELEDINICKPDKKEPIEACVMDEGKKQNLSPFLHKLDLNLETGLKNQVQGKING